MFGGINRFVSLLECGQYVVRLANFGASRAYADGYE
jgi:hypothetical protein